MNYSFFFFLRNDVWQTRLPLYYMNLDSKKMMCSKSNLRHQNTRANKTLSHSHPKISRRRSTEPRRPPGRARARSSGKDRGPPTTFSRQLRPFVRRAYLHRGRWSRPMVARPRTKTESRLRQMGAAPRDQLTVGENATPIRWTTPATVPSSSSVGLLIISFLFQARKGAAWEMAAAVCEIFELALLRLLGEIVAGIRVFISVWMGRDSAIRIVKFLHCYLYDE